MQLYCFTVLILEGAGKLINWKAIGFQLRLYFFLAHCAFQVNTCGILLERKRKMKLWPDWGKSNITPNQGLHPSLFLTCSFFVAHIVYKQTSSSVHISCPQLPPAVPHSSQFSVLSEVLQRQTRVTLETRIMNTCWREKTPPPEGTESHKWCHLTALTSEALSLRFTTSGNVTISLYSRLPSNIHKREGAQETKAKCCKRKDSELPCEQSWHICKLLIACKYWMKCVELMGNFYGVACSYRGIPP